MKFDCIIMNPPYRRNLHLKILAEAITHLKDETSTCVNLSPVRWLQDPLAKYKKNSDWYRFQESVAKHIKDVESIDGDEISMIFNCGMPQTGIFVIDSSTHKIYEKAFYISFVDKMYLYLKDKCNFDFEKDKIDGFRVKISPIYGGGTAGNHSNGTETIRNIGKLICFHDGLKDGKPWHKFYAHNGSTKIQDEIPFSIKFNSSAEAENFIKSYNTKIVRSYTHFVKRDVHISPSIIVWMGDSINPRTGKKGYEDEWTDSDFYTFFGITPEEQKVIEETMEKYK